MLAVGVSGARACRAVLVRFLTAGGAQVLITFDREAARLLDQGNEPVVLLAER